MFIFMPVYVVEVVAVIAVVSRSIGAVVDAGREYRSSSSSRDSSGRGSCS
jgi:hypothetical protein